MKKFLLVIGTIACLFSPVIAQTPDADSGKEGIEWCDIWVTHANETKLPRVLLIGDSITKGYAGEVQKQLDGKACLARLCTSCFDTDPALLGYISTVLQSYHFQVIQFNNGMHGWAHSEVEYAQGLPPLLATIRKYAPDAKLIWANTTPLNDGTAKPGSNSSEPIDPSKADADKLMLRGDLKDKSNARVNARNAIAAKLMEAENIPINDLHSVVSGRAELYHGDVHFNAAGTALQGTQVAGEIEKVLGK